MEIVLDHAMIGHDVPMAYRMTASMELAMYETAMYNELKQYTRLTPGDIYDARRKVDRLPSREHISRMTREFTKKRLEIYETCIDVPSGTNPARFN